MQGPPHCIGGKAEAGRGGTGCALSLVDGPRAEDPVLVLRPALPVRKLWVKSTASRQVPVPPTQQQLPQPCGAAPRYKVERRVPSLEPRKENRKSTHLWGCALPEAGKERKEAVLNFKTWTHPYSAPLPPDASPLSPTPPIPQPTTCTWQAPAAPLSSEGVFWAHRLQTPLHS